VLLIFLQQFPPYLLPHEKSKKNAEIVLTKDREKLQRQEARSVGAVKEIEELLSLPNLKRMEAYDISNISGVQSVGSMVVYENGMPKKSDYRNLEMFVDLGSNKKMDLKFTNMFVYNFSQEMSIEKGIGIFKLKLRQKFHQKNKLDIV